MVSVGNATSIAAAVRRGLFGTASKPPATQTIRYWIAWIVEYIKNDDIYATDYYLSTTIVIDEQNMNTNGTYVLNYSQTSLLWVKLMAIVRHKHVICLNVPIQRIEKLLNL